MEDVFSYANTVKETSSYAFQNTKIAWCTLHVPESSITLYSKNKPWSDFGNIVALTNNDPKPTGIVSIVNADNVSVVGYYTLEGQRIDLPRKGVNIVKMSDGTVKKIVIK